MISSGGSHGSISTYVNSSSPAVPLTLSVAVAASNQSCEKPRMEGPVTDCAPLAFCVVSHCQGFPCVLAPAGTLSSIHGTSFAPKLGAEATGVVHEVLPARSNHARPP